MSIGTPYKVAAEAALTTNSTDASITTNAPANAGDTLFVWVAQRLGNAAQIASVSGPVGGTGEIVPRKHLSNAQAVSVYRVKLTSTLASGSVITVTLDASTSRKVVGAFAVPGLADVAKDTWDTGAQGGTGNPTTGTTGTPSAADSIAIAFYQHSTTGSTETGTVAAGWTKIGEKAVGTSSQGAGFVQYKILAAAAAQGPVAYTPSLSTTVAWVCELVVWKAAGGATVTGAAALTGTGSSTVAGVRTRLGAAALTGAGSSTVAGTRTRLGAAALTGTGSSSATGYKDGDVVRVVGTAAITGNDSLALVITVAGKAARAGNTLALAYGSQSQLVGAIANSTGTDVWALNEATRQNAGATNTVSVSSCRLTSDLAVGATVSATPAAAAASKNAVLLELQGALTKEAGTPGGNDSGITGVTSLTVAAGGATNQPSSTIIVAGIWGGDPGTLTATGYVVPAGASSVNVSGTLRYVGMLVRQTTSSETPSAPLAWTTSRAAAAALVAYGKPVTGNVTGAVALTGVGSSTVAGVHTARAAAALTGVGSSSSSGVRTRLGAAALSGAGTLLAVTGAPLVVAEYTGTPRFVLAATGERILLRGVNTIQSSSDTDRRATLLSLGCNMVRVVLNWHNLEPTAPTGSGTNFSTYVHTLDSAALAQLDVDLQTYADAGLYFQVDMHQASWSPYYGGSGVPSWYYTDARFQTQQNGGAGWNNSTDKSSAIAAFWTDAEESAMSQRLYIDVWRKLIAHLLVQPYADHLVGYHVFNEPNPGNLGGSSASKVSAMHTWLAPVVDAIDGDDPARAKFLMCRGGGQGYGTATFAEFTDLIAQKCVLEFHAYYVGLAPGRGADTAGEVGYQGPDNDDYYPDSNTVHTTTAGNTYTGSEVYQEAWNSVPLDKAAALGLPAFLGECGVHPDDTGRLAYIADVQDAIDAVSLSATVWKLGRYPGDSLGLLDTSGALLDTGTAWQTWFQSTTFVIGDVTGAAALSGAGTLASGGRQSVRAAAALTGLGTLSASGVDTRPGGAVLAGAGTLSASGKLTRKAAAALTGVGSSSAAGKLTRKAAAALTGAGTLAAAGVHTGRGSAALSGAGTLAATGTTAITAAALLRGRGGLMATGTPDDWAWDRGSYDDGGRANAAAYDPLNPRHAVMMGDVWGFFETWTDGDIWRPIMSGCKVHLSGVAGDIYGRSAVFSRKHSGRVILGAGTLTGGPSGWWGHRDPGGAQVTKDSTFYGFGTTGGNAALTPRPTGQLQDVDFDSGTNTEYVYAGTNRGIVRMVDGAGAPVFTLLGAAAEPNGEWKFVCVAPDGSVYAGSYGNRGAVTPTSGTVYRVTSPRTTGTVTADTGAPAYVNDMRVIDGTLWACTEGGGLYTVAPGGAWTQRASTFFAGCDLASVDGVDGVIYVLTASHPAGSDKWIARSLDGGTSWTWLQTVVETVQGAGRHFWLSPAGDGDDKGPDDSWGGLLLRVDPSDPDRFIVAGFRGGWASQDGGATWQPCGNGLGGSEVAKVEIQGDGSVKNTDVDWKGAQTFDFYSGVMTPLAVTPTLGTASLAAITFGGHTYALTLPTDGTPPDCTLDGVSIADDYFRDACMSPSDWDVGAQGIVIALFGGGILRARPTAAALATLGAANLSGTGTLSAAGRHDARAAVALAGAGTLTAAGTLTRKAAAALTGAGTLAAAGTRGRLGAAALTGSGSSSSSGVRTVFGAATLAGAGTLAAAGMAHVFAGRVVADDAARADQGPPPSANWQTDPEGYGAAGFTVTGNRFAPASSGDSEMAWIPDTFGPDVDMAFDLPVVPPVGEQIDLEALTNWSVVAQTGYDFQYRGDGLITLYRADSGAYNSLATATQVLSNGDAIRLRVAGPVVECWVRLAGVWTREIQVSDSTYRGPFKVGVYTSGGTMRLDNFAASTLAVELTGTGSLTASGTTNLGVLGTAHLTGTGSSSTSATRTAIAAAHLTGVGSSTTTGARTRLGAAALTATSSITATGARTRTSAAHLTGTSSSSTSGTLTRKAAAALTGSGSMIAAGQHDLTGAAALTGFGVLTASALRIVNGQPAEFESRAVAGPAYSTTTTSTAYRHPPASTTSYRSRVATVESKTGVKP